MAKSKAAAAETTVQESPAETSSASTAASERAPQDEIDRRRASGGLPNAFDDDDEDEDDPAAQSAEQRAGVKPADEEGEEADAMAGDPDAEDEPALETPAATEPETPDVSDDVRRSCELYSLDPQDFAPGALERHIAKLDKMFYDAGAASVAAAQPPAAPQAAAPAAPAAAAPSPPNPVSVTVPDFKPDYAKIEAEYGPDIANHLKTLHETMTAQRAADQAALKSEYEKRLSVLEEKHTQAERAEDERRRQDTARNCDDFWQKLGPAWEPIFGKGSGSELLKTADGKLRHQDRIKHLEARDILEAGYLQRGMAVPDEHSLMQKALQFAFPEKIKEIAEASIREKSKARQRQFTARPTQRTAAPKTSREKTSENLDAAFERLGMTPAAETEEEYAL